MPRRRPRHGPPHAAGLCRSFPPRRAWAVPAGRRTAPAPCATRAVPGRRPEATPGLRYSRPAATETRPATSPRRSWGAPTTATSRTPGNSCKTSSISLAPTRCAPTLIMSWRRPDQEQKALGVGVAEIAGSISERAEPLRGFLGIVPVASARCSSRAPRARRPRRAARAAPRWHDEDLDVRNRPADRAQLVAQVAPAGDTSGARTLPSLRT